MPLESLSQFFVPCAGVPDAQARLRDSVLVLPAVSFGNVGQLAIDLLLNTAAKQAPDAVQLLGYINSAYILPVCGHDAIPAVGAGSRPFIAAEVYGIRDTHAVLVQLRGRVATGRAVELSTQLVEWAREAGVGQVCVLSGASLTTRHDPARMSAAEWIVSLAEPAAALQAQLEHAGAAALDSVSAVAQGAGAALRDPLAVPLPGALADCTPAPLSDALRHSGLLLPLLEQARAAELPACGLVRYCFEGDNTADGARVANTANLALRMVRETDGAVAWRMPESWGAAAFGSKFDESLF